MRENEFVERIRGKTYAQIVEEDGGIRATVEAVRKASLDELVELALPRLRRMLAQGVDHPIREGCRARRSRRCRG